MRTRFARALSSIGGALALTIPMPVTALHAASSPPAAPAPTETDSLPNAPPGHYTVFQFRTSFAHLASAVETVALVQESDGHWRAAGYWIR